MDQLKEYFALVDKDPFFRMDFPDVDVIRVEDTYYCITTTMHYFPGAQILESKDLIHWKHKTYLYEVLDSTDGQRLQDGKGIYGKGMWAASLRYHKGIFYVCFVANDTGKTYLYRSGHILGPWEKTEIEGFYHDCSLLFDDDGKTYIAYGNRTVYLTELNDDLTAPKEGGLHRVLIQDQPEALLGYEGTSVLKINGTYYFFFIHSLVGQWRRTECCFYTDDLKGELFGGEAFNEDLGYRYAGIAQGTIVDTPSGEWYAFLFQDRGAAGRMPVLMPVHFENKWPVFESPMVLNKEKLLADLKKERMESCEQEKNRLYVEKDDFLASRLHSLWQINHEPDWDLIRTGNQAGGLRITSGTCSKKLSLTRNIVTQRLLFPTCAVSVFVDGTQLQEKDQAGICGFLGNYGFLALEKNAFGMELVLGHSAEAQDDISERKAVALNCLYLQMEAFFGGEKEYILFSYREDENSEWKYFGKPHEVFFALDHFTGCRVGLFVKSQTQTGGTALFTDFSLKDSDILSNI